MDDSGLIKFLISQAPEFKEISSQLNKESAYLQFGYFAVFLIEAIEEGKNEGLINRSFHLLNDLINLNDTSINTLLRVEVLELLADNQTSIPFCIERLESPALELFNKVLKFLETGLMPATW